MRVADLDEYRSLINSSFINTHDPYDVDAVSWPDLDDNTRSWLGNLPIWDDAVQAEQDTAVIVGAMVRAEPDPMFREAIALQAYEEDRHARLVRSLTRHYGFSTDPHTSPVPTHPVWSFLVSGWGECIDSFFAFGLFKVAEQLPFLPKELLKLFDLVMREEARHIVFFENWSRYRRLTRSIPSSATLRAANASAAFVHVADRAVAGVQLARQQRPGTNFILSGAQTVPGLTVSAFLDTCLTANDERLGTFDPRLARPWIAPAIVQMARLRRLHFPSAPPQPARLPNPGRPGLV
jgi:hypothetical protein